MKKYILTAFCVALSLCAYGESKMNQGIFLNLNAEEFYEKYSTMTGESSYILLDVRTPEEYASGHIDKAINIDFYASDFGDRINKLDKSKKYLVYCRSGNRSEKTMNLMKNLRFKEVYNLTGGIKAWELKSYPVKK